MNWYEKAETRRQSRTIVLLFFSVSVDQKQSTLYVHVFNMFIISVDFLCFVSCFLSSVSITAAVYYYYY